MKLVLISLSLVVGCAGATKNNGFADEDAGPVSGNDGGGEGDGNGTMVVTRNDGGGPTAGGVSVLYAHTAKDLYQLDPKNISAPMVPIGTFDCIGGTGPSSMTDIAVSKDGALYGVSAQGAYPLQLPGGGKVHCAATWPLPGTHTNFYGLTMAPENTLDAAEVLVAANDLGQLFRIDATTGKTTPLL